MSINNNYVAGLNPNILAVEEKRDNSIDWYDLNRLIKIIENFRSFNGTGINTTVPAPKAAFRITMKDNKPVFNGTAECVCPENSIAGVVVPKVYTANNAGNRTAPYTYIKSPVPGTTQPGGVVFIPPTTRRKKRSFVDLITWNNILKNNTPGAKPAVIHPERQFLYWLQLQKAKDPNFINRIKKINMRMAHVPCKTCTHSLASKLTKIVGSQPKINIRLSDNNGNAVKSPAIGILNRHPNITVKSVAAGLHHPAVKNKVLQAIAHRQIKQGIKPAGPIHKAMARQAILNHPAVKSKVIEAIAERKLKQAGKIPAGAHKAAVVASALSHPAVKSKVIQAIAERKLKQAASAAAKTPQAHLASRPPSIQAAKARINNLKQMKKEMEFEMF